MIYPGAVVALVVAVGVVTPTGPATAAVPGTFDLSTTAVGVNATSTQAPAASVVTAGLVDVTEAYATSQLTSYGTAASAAAGVYPGNLVAGGPTLLCESFGPCPFDPPTYPLVAEAGYPTAPTASAPGASARASGRDTGADSAAAAQAAGPVTVESAAASTHAWVDGTGAHVRSRSLVTGITAGPLRITSLEALDVVDVAADGAVRDQPHVTVTGVTVAGQPAAVDDSGVHLLGTTAGARVPALAQQGLDVRLLGASRQDRSGAVRSAAGGLLVTVSVPVTGVPQLVPGLPGLNRRYVGSVLVGGAGAVVAAAAEAGLVVMPPPVRPGSPAEHLTPPYRAPSLATSGVGALVPGALPPAAPEVSGSRVRGVPLYPLASVRSAALALLLLPLLLLLAWRALIAQAGRRA